jgi:hypothetical protein
MSNFNIDFGTISKKVDDLFNNKYFFSTLSLFLVMYGGLAAPKLPVYITKWFENPIVRILIFFLIAYLGTKNQSLAIITAVCLVITLQTLSKQKMNGELVDNLLGQIRKIGDTVGDVLLGPGDEKVPDVPVQENMTVVGFDGVDYASL